ALARVVHRDRVRPEIPRIGVPAAADCELARFRARRGLDQVVVEDVGRPYDIAVADRRVGEAGVTLLPRVALWAWVALRARVALWARIALRPLLVPRQRVLGGLALRVVRDGAQGTGLLLVARLDSSTGARDPPGRRSHAAGGGKDQGERCRDVCIGQV